MLKKIISLILTLACALSLFACNSGKDNLESGNSTESSENTVMTDKIFFENGRTDYRVVVPEYATSYELIASDELVNFIKESTGFQMEVISDDKIECNLEGKYISLGNTTLKTAAKINTDKIGVHAYIAKTVSNSVIIAGGNDVGTVYGVYYFLEKQINYKYYNGDEIEYSKIVNVNLVNVNMTKIPTTKQFWVGYKSADNYYRAKLRLKANNTFQINRWPHSHFSFISPDKYGDAHPDWFNSAKTALCLTNEEMWDEMAKQIIAAADNDESIVNVMLGAEDSWDTCHCEECQKSDEAYTHTGTDIIFANAVAERISNHYQSIGSDRVINIFMLNYYNTETPPVVFNEKTQKYEPIDEKVIPRENVYTHVCYINGDYSSSFTDPDRNAKNIIDLEGWKALTDNNTAYLYNGFFINEGLVFFNDFSFKADTYKTLNDYGYKFIFVEGSPTKVCTFEAMRTYITAELLYDCNQNVNDLTSDFIKHYYKEAAPYIQEYFDKIQLHLEVMKAEYESENKAFGACVQFEMNKYIRTARTWPERVLRQYMDLFSKSYDAIKAAGYDSATMEKMNARIAQEELSVRYLLLLLHKESFAAAEYENLVAQFNADAAQLGSIITIQG